MAFRRRTADRGHALNLPGQRPPATPDVADFHWRLWLMEAKACVFHRLMHPWKF